MSEVAQPSVSRRAVFLVGGYERNDATGFFRRIGREMDRFRKCWSVDCVLGTPVETLNSAAMTAPVDYRGPDGACQTDITFLSFDDIRIDDLAISSAGEAVIDIRHARGGLRASSGELTLESIDVDSDRGRFRIDGRYAPADNYAMDVTATAVFPAHREDQVGGSEVTLREVPRAMRRGIGGCDPP